MSFSSLVSDIAYRSSERPDRPDFRSQVSEARSTRSYASTAATSVSISGDIKSQLHGGYSHPLSRAWQAERQLTKVRSQRSSHSVAHGS
jgi:porphobilinogen synthase